MKKLTLSAIALAALVAAPFTAAKADPVPGWYLAAGGMFHDAETADAHFFPGQNTVGYNVGWGVEGAGGYSFDNGFRLEGEVAQMRAGVHAINGGTGGSGSLMDTTFTTNLYYDFKTGTILTPYIGIGGGLDLVNASDIGRFSDGANLNDNQMVFVWQAIAGIAAQIDRNWAITADYRFIDTTDPRFAASTGPAVSMDNVSHNIVVGVRYTFSKPLPPAPAVAQAPAITPAAPVKPAVAAVPQSYMVFFDFNKDTLTPEAKHIIASAAQDFRGGGYVRIVVTGHTDTVGSNSYNQKLSERRAASVKAELESLGVTDAQVATEGVGKGGLMVPTANGVREAQNRRAEIVLDKQ